MQIQINKSNLYIGFASNFTCAPIIAKSEKQVLLDIEDEIYRTCNWLNKKPPKDMSSFKATVRTIPHVDTDIEFFENGEFNKNEFNDIQLAIAQGLFSYKCMVESVMDYQALDKLAQVLKGIYLSLTGDNLDGGFLETGFKLLESLEENSTLSKERLKAYAYKTLFVIVNEGKIFYNEKVKQFENITNSFCF